MQDRNYEDVSGSVVKLKLLEIKLHKWESATAARRQKYGQKINK